MTFAYSKEQLKHLVEFALQHATKLGASDAAADVSESSGLSVNVRMGQVETIENTRDKSFGITVYQGQRRGHAASSDFTENAILQTIQAAIDIARFTAEDEFAGLPESELLEKNPRDLDLYHPWHLDSDQAISLALMAEQAALKLDKRIRNSDGANIGTESGQFMAGNTRGFLAGYPYSRHSLSVSPIAQSKKNDMATMQRDYWYTSARCHTQLASPNDVGQYAAQRALARLNPKTITTQQCPVLFEAPLAVGLLGSFVQAVSGSALYRKSTFLLDCLGKQVFPEHIQIHEDPFILQAMGSSPFDEEGVSTHRRDVVRNGEVLGYFLSCYAARKLGMQTTGHAGGSHNLRLTSQLTNSQDDLPAMIKKMHRGLLVTELLGQGVNYITGDYSRGAFGYWVENGEIAYPVQELTIAGNLKEMFKSIVAVGSDEFKRGSKWIGSVLIESMTVASGSQG